jgi:CRISPR/Cas system-associated exonuclease Cas4 (RecB family)
MLFEMERRTIEATAHQIATFLYCPRKYYFEEKMKAYMPKDEYQEAMQQCISYFWWKRLEGHCLSIFELKNRWASLYKTRDNLAIMGADELWNFFQVFGEDRSNLHYVDFVEPVEIAGHRITPRIDVIRSQGRKEIDLLDFRFGKKEKTELALAMDVEITIASYAFRKLMKRTEDKTIVFYTRRGRTFNVRRSKVDFDNLERIIDDVASCIENNNYTPRGDCNGCEYSKLCVKGGKFMANKAKIVEDMDAPVKVVNEAGVEKELKKENDERDTDN